MTMRLAGALVLVWCAFFSSGCADVSSDQRPVNELRPAPTDDINEEAGVPAGTPIPTLRRLSESSVGGGFIASSIALPVAAAEVDTTQQQPAPTAQVMIYTGALRMNVANGTQTLDAIKHIAQTAGGYLDEMDSHSITVRVPAAKFDSIVESVKRLGEVIDQQIKVVDVTEQMHDLDIRLDNAEQTRERLLKLIETSSKVEDTLKIEDELEKVTETIELTKGKIRDLQSQAAFSTLRVEVNARQNQMIAGATPFPWIADLGRGAVSGATPQQSDSGGLFGNSIGFELPPGFIRYYQGDDQTEAMSADGMYIKAHRHDNYKGGDVTFWSALARKTLVENQSLIITRESDVKANGHLAKMIEGNKEIAGGTQGYLLLITTDSDHVYIFEAWGPKEQIEKSMASLEKSARTLG